MRLELIKLADKQASNFSTNVKHDTSFLPDWTVILEPKEGDYTLEIQHKTVKKFDDSPLRLGVSFSMTIENYYPDNEEFETFLVDSSSNKIFDERLGYSEEFPFYRHNNKVKFDEFLEKMIYEGKDNGALLR